MLDAILRDPTGAALPADAPTLPATLADAVAARRRGRDVLAHGGASAEDVDLVRAALVRGGLLQPVVIEAYAAALTAGAPLEKAALRTAARLADEALRAEDEALCTYARRLPPQYASQVRMLLAAVSPAGDPLAVQGPDLAGAVDLNATAEALAVADGQARAEAVRALGRRS